MRLRFGRAESVSVVEARAHGKFIRTRATAFLPFRIGFPRGNTSALRNSVAAAADRLRYIHQVACDLKSGTPGRDPYSCSLAEHWLALLFNSGLKVQRKKNAM